MADAAPVPTPALNPDTDYKPLSGLAIAAIALAGLFAVILLGFVVVGFISKRPIDEGWHLWLAAVGFVLAILARIQIRRSEGIRTGQKLADAAWWICLLGGGGFFAYLQANEFSLRLQSGKYLDAWFDALKKGDRAASFLLALEPEQRRDPSLNPADPALEERLNTEFAHMYPGYRNHSVVTTIVRGGDAITAAQQGLKRWEYRTASTSVEWTYRISGPEGVSLATVSLLGTRPKGEKSLSWRIDANTNFTLRPENFTTYGRFVNHELPREAERALGAWLEKTHLPRSLPGDEYPTSRKWDAFRMTLSPAERDVFLSKMIASVANLSLTRGPVLPPDYPNYFTLPPGFFRNAQGQPATEEELQKFRRAWLFDGFRPAGMSASRGEFKISAEGVTVRYPVEFVMPFTGDRYQGTVIAQLLDEKVREQLNQLRKEGIANPMARDDGKTKLASPLDENSSWQIIGIESDLKPVVMEKDGPK
jgi:hypothetical protein